MSKKTYTITAQDGTIHTRTTARTYTHCITATGIHHPATGETRHYNLPGDGVLGWAGSPELAAKQVATRTNQGFLNVQAVPCTLLLKSGQRTSRQVSKATKSGKEQAMKTAKKTAKKNTKKASPKASRKTRKATGPKVAGLTGSQVRILTAVAKAKGNVSYNDVRVATGILKGLTRMMAANSSKGASYPNSLEGQGLIKSHEAQDNHGRARFCFAVTAKGTKTLKAAPKAAPKAKAKKAPKKASKVAAKGPKLTAPGLAKMLKFS